MLAITVVVMAAPVASAETRTLKLYYTHTRERAEITFKKNGRYIQSGLDQLNKFLRDWRRNEPTKMDPRLFDIVWEAYQAVGARDYIHVVSAYRSPATNSMLRKRSKGVAEKSQHMLGKAMDFYIPGVKLATLRAAGLRIQGGGVGYYPTSGSPFVHLDVGNVRHWPRMNRNELMALFPDGKTIHVPTDGKPLPGYNQALAAYQSRKASGASTAIQVASARRSGGFLSRLFGGGADEEEDTGEIAVAAAAPEAIVGRKPSAVPAARAKSTLPGVEEAGPATSGKTAPEPAAQPKPETPETIIAALPARSIPTPLFAPRPQAEVGAQTADAVPGTGTAEAAQIMASAQAIQVALNIPIPTPRPNYTPLTKPVPEVQPATAAAEDDIVVATVASKRRPDSGSLAIADLLAAERMTESKAGVPTPIPTQRPDWPEEAIAYAPLAETSVENASLTGPSAQMAALAAGKAVASRKNGRVAAPSPRLALLGRESSVDAASVLGTGVRTTAKAGKPDAGDQKPDPRPVVIPVQEEIARWALQASNVTRPLRSATKPARAHDAIREAPREVYTLGFQQGAVADASRFSGKAVTFLAVAKFSEN